MKALESNHGERADRFEAAFPGVAAVTAVSALGGQDKGPGARGGEAGARRQRNHARAGVRSPSEGEGDAFPCSSGSPPQSHWGTQPRWRPSLATVPGGRSLVTY